MNDSIKEFAIKELINAGTSCSACLVGDQGGFFLNLQYGTAIKTLVSAKGKLRKFGSLNSAVEFLKQLGISKFEVDASLYQPGLIRKARPDRAKALRNTRTKPQQQELLSS